MALPLKPALTHVHARGAGKAKVLASALKDAGIKAGEKVGIYASNCPEWMLCILAANRSSISVGEQRLSPSGSASAYAPCTSVEADHALPCVLAQCVLTTPAAIHNACALQAPA